MKLMASQTSCCGKVEVSNCGMARSRPALSPGLDEEDEEGDQQRVERHRLGQREADHAEAEDLAAGGRVAGDRADQRAEDRADADADAGQSDNGETGADHSSGLKVHWKV